MARMFTDTERKAYNERMEMLQVGFVGLQRGRHTERLTGGTRGRGFESAHNVK